MKKFDYSLDYRQLNLREHPELYAIGRGEQGVLLVQPYKSEILPHWRFKTPAEARKSANKIHRIFLAYLRADDFVGADMARKFLQMGYTRSRRYANYRGGKKYDGPVPKEQRGRSGAHGRAQLPRQEVEDPAKAESARIFREKWDKAKQNRLYIQMKKEFQEKYPT